MRLLKNENGNNLIKKLFLFCLHICFMKCFYKEADIR